MREVLLFGRLIGSIFCIGFMCCERFQHGKIFTSEVDASPHVFSALCIATFVQIWATMRLFVDQLIVHPRCPAVVSGVARKVLAGIDRYMLSLQQGAQAHHAAQ